MIQYLKLKKIAQKCPNFTSYSWVCMNLLNSEQPFIKVTTLTISMPFLPCFSAFSRFSLKKLMNIHFDLQFFLSAIRYLLDLPKKTALRVATELEMRKNKREDWHFLKLTTSIKEARGNVYHVLIFLKLTTSERLALIIHCETLHRVQKRSFLSGG